MTTTFPGRPRARKPRGRSGGGSPHEPRDVSSLLAAYRAARVGGTKRARMLLDERITAEGVRSCTWLTCDGTQVQIRDDDGVLGALPVAALDRIMVRYGRPLDSTVPVEGESVSCGVGTLRRLRHRAAVDAEARDYLVWECPRQEPLAALGITVTAALRFLIVRLSRGAVLSTPGSPDRDESSQ